MENKNKYTPCKCDVFKWADEEYICIESYKTCGVVNKIGEKFYYRNFIWDYAGEKPEFVRKATESELERLFAIL